MGKCQKTNSLTYFHNREHSVQYLKTTGIFQQGLTATCNCWIAHFSSHEEFSTFYSGKATPHTYRTAAGLRTGPELNKFHSLWHSSCSFMNPALRTWSKSLFYGFAQPCRLKEHLEHEWPFQDNPYCPRILSFGLSDMEFSQIPGARTHCTEGTNQIAVSESEPSADLTEVFTAQIFAFPRFNSLEVGQFLEMFFRRQEAQSCKALCLALPETPHNPFSHHFLCSSCPFPPLLPSTSLCTWVHRG